MESARRLEKTEEPRTSENTVVSHEESAQRGRVGVMDLTLMKRQPKHSWDGKEHMLLMQPCKVKNVGESARTHGERRTDGKGQTVVTSGQAGTAGTATTQGNWVQVRTMEKVTREGQSSSGRHHQLWQQSGPQELGERTKSSWLEDFWEKQSNTAFPAA